MGRVYKTFIARRGGRRTKGKALVDSGADVTMLDNSTACAIGFDVHDAEPAEIEAFGGARVAGARFSVDMQVGKRRAQLYVFVPADKRRDERIIGHDFLQATQAQLDYDKEHRQTFSGYDPMTEPATAGIRVRKLTGARAAAVRRQMLRACAVPRRRRRPK